MIRTVRFVLFFTFVLLLSVVNANAVKLTDDARRHLASADGYPGIFWLFIDVSGWSEQPLTLTPKATTRRAKVDPVDFIIDELDYPISSAVLDSLEANGFVVRQASRWLKAVSIELDSSGMGKVMMLPFIDSVGLVRTCRVSPPLPVEQPFDPGRHIPQVLADLPYGASIAQNSFINAVPVHTAGLTGAGVLLALIDTGFDILHPGLDSASILATWDFIYNTVDVTTLDCPEEVERNHQNSHGTAVLGVLATYMPDTLIGVAYGADYILARTEISCGGTEIRVEEDNWIAAAEWADSIGADIISSSLGYYSWQDDDDYTLDDLDGNTAYITRVADIAASKNILVVTSAGNERGNTWNRITFPADGDSVLAVGATAYDSSLAGFSSPGPTADGRIKPDVSTLGVNVLTLRALPERGLRYTSGTSFAAPLVAGVAALAFENNPDLTAAELFQTFLATSSQSDNPDNDFGYGLVDAYHVADLVCLQPLPPLNVRVGVTSEWTITTTGGADVTPVITGINLPAGVFVIDQYDGTAILQAMGIEENPFHVEFLITAEANGVIDSMIVSLETFGLSSRHIYAGPNPFSDTVNIFSDSTAGLIRTVSIYNSAGEIVWEIVNRSAVSADAISRWDRVQWDGRSRSGKRVSAGIYLVRVETEQLTALLKLLKSN